MTRSDATGGSSRGAMDPAVTHPWLTAEPVIRPMQDVEFERFRVYIQRESGISLVPAKKDLLAGRLLRRMRELGVRTFDDYYRLLVDGDGAEQVSFLNAVSTNETRFFREPRHFDFLRERVIAGWIARAEAGLMPRRARLWSAGCATGEEPYSLAMLAADHCPAAGGWDIEILATDLSTRALDRARSAIWSLEKADEIPDPYLKAYMLKGVGGRQGQMKAGMEIRSLVRCARVNLNDAVYPVPGLFDVIFCRNVLIYFDRESKARVIGRLAARLAPGGYLFVGQVEGLTGLADQIRAAGPTVYVRVDRAPGKGNPDAAPGSGFDARTERGAA